jgi:hypothetical protein
VRVSERVVSVSVSESEGHREMNLHAYTCRTEELQQQMNEILKIK